MDSKCKETFKSNELSKKECTLTLTFPKNEGCFEVWGNSAIVYDGLASAYFCPSRSVRMSVDGLTAFDLDKVRMFSSQSELVDYKDTRCGSENNQQQLKTSVQKSGNKIILKMVVVATAPYIEIREWKQEGSKIVDYIPKMYASEIDCDENLDFGRWLQ